MTRIVKMQSHLIFTWLVWHVEKTLNRSRIVIRQWSKILEGPRQRNTGNSWRHFRYFFVRQFRFVESEKLFGAQIFAGPSQPVSGSPLIRNVKVSSAAFSGLDDELSLANGFSERIGGDDRVQSGVGFADPVKDDAVTDRIDLPDFDPPIRDVLVWESVVVFGVDRCSNGLVIFVPDKFGDRPSSDFNLNKNKDGARLQTCVVRISWNQNTKWKWLAMEKNPAIKLQFKNNLKWLIHFITALYLYLP